jgi:hypothetical protein
MTELYEHQKLALRKLSNGKILWGGVGSGKTRVAVEYYLLREAPRHVYVITTARKRDDFDWQREFYEHGVGPVTGPNYGPNHRALPGRVHQSGGGERDGSSLGQGNQSSGALGEAASDALEEGGVDGAGGNDRSVEVSRRLGQPGLYPWVLTVDSWQNIGKYADVKDAFFIFDEQRLVGAGEWSQKFLSLAKKNHWILLTATPGDTWMDYISVFVANGFYKNRTEFKRDHVVYNTFTKFPKVDRYINVAKLARHRSAVLVHMPFDRHTRRRHVEVMLDYDRDLLNRVLKERWHVYEDRPLRDVGEMFMVMRKVVNSDPSRLEMVKELWKNHPKLIVFYNFNFELEVLRNLALSSGMLSTRDSESSLSTLPMLLPDLSATRGTSNSRLKSTMTRGLRNETRLSPTQSSTKDGNSWETKSGHTSRNQTIASISASAKLMKRSSSTSERIHQSGTVSKTVSDSTRTGTTEDDLLTSSEKPLSEMTPANLKVFSTIPNNLLKQSSKDTSPYPPSNGKPMPVIGEWNGHKHQPVPTSDCWLYLVQYTAGAEAWNCVTTDAMVLFSQNYSWKIMEQAYGRIDRLNTPFNDLWYYGFTSDSMIDKAISKSLATKEDFNTRKYRSLFES